MEPAKDRKDLLLASKHQVVAQIAAGDTASVLLLVYAHAVLSVAAHCSALRGRRILRLADPPDRALLLFQRDSDTASAFAAADPYVEAGLVTRWSGRPWTTAAGELAGTPPTSQDTSGGHLVLPAEERGSPPLGT
jgi:hypothetical protein